MDYFLELGFLRFHYFLVDFEHIRGRQLLTKICDFLELRELSSRLLRFLVELNFGIPLETDLMNLHQILRRFLYLGHC